MRLQYVTVICEIKKKLVDIVIIIL